MKIGIVGAGAIGLWLAGRLASAGSTISVLARGQTLKTLVQSGVTVITAEGTRSAGVSASDRPADFEHQDLVIFAVKGQDLPNAAEAAQAMIGPSTLLLPAMNGVPWWFLKSAKGNLAAQPLRSVDPDGKCEKALPTERVIGGVVHASCSVERPGVVRHVMGNGIIIGAAGGLEATAVTGVQNVLATAGFDASHAEDIRYDIWYKLWGNMTMNPISALTGASCDLILDDPDARAFASAIMDEAAAVGAAIGCPITQSPDDRHDITRQLGAFKTSMLQDAEAGRPLEIGALLEAPREIAQLAGIATPALDDLLGLMRVFSAARTGRTDAQG